MYQQQNHPIDDMLREHTYGVTVSTTPKLKPRPKKKKVLIQKKQKQGKYGYTYNIDGTFQ